MATIKDFVYIRRTLDGMTIDIPREQLDDHLRRIRWSQELNKSVPEFELAGDIDKRGSIEAPLVPENSLACPLCGAVFGTERALKLHKTKNHK